MTRYALYVNDEYPREAHFVTAIFDTLAEADKWARGFCKRRFPSKWEAENTPNSYARYVYRGAPGCTGLLTFASEVSDAGAA